MSTVARTIPIAQPLLDEREADAVRRVILSGWVTQGPEVAAFEQEFARYVGAPYACAVSNCTTALHLALLAVGVGPGDEVITVSHSFIATANSIVYCGATPVLVDVEADTGNIDPARVEAAITPKTRAILCVHQLGMPCDVRTLVELGDRRGIPVIEDAACAIGSEIRRDGAWEKIGKPLGRIACFSFHPRKVITTGDGGMLTTSNEQWDQQFRLWRQHGMSVPDTVRHSARDVVFESYTTVGYNYRMTDLQAAVGREQLARLPGLIATRRRMAGRYAELLAGSGIGVPVEPSWARSNWQSYCVMLPEGVDQVAVMRRMLADGVSTRRGVMNVHLEPAYGAVPRVDLRNGEMWQHRGLILPLFPQMTDEDQQAVARALVDACAASGPSRGSR
jgi:dTDP-4-amino-4,6-dideoxygalactose transaminase